MSKARYLLSLVMLMPFAVLAFGNDTVTFSAEDGLLITADIHAPYNNGEAPIIVLFHQAGSSRGEYTDIVPWLNMLGYNSMTVDQRSGGVSRGIENETASRAAKENRQTGYLAALPDIKAALLYARRHYGKGGVIAWGSSYSAALVLQLAGEFPDLVDGVLAFSSGEYFVRAGKSDTWIEVSARHITDPVFITSSRNEVSEWQDIFTAIEPGNKVSFIPQTDGRHGSRALWEKYPDSDAYRDAVRSFLERFFPASR